MVPDGGEGQAPSSPTDVLKPWMRGKAPVVA